MKLILPIALLTLTTACATSPSDSGLCIASDQLRKDHAAALLADGGEQSKTTGERLLRGFRSQCEALT